MKLAGSYCKTDCTQIFLVGAQVINIYGTWWFSSFNWLKTNNWIFASSLQCFADSTKKSSWACCRTIQITKQMPQRQFVYMQPADKLVNWLFKWFFNNWTTPHWYQYWMLLSRNQLLLFVCYQLTFYSISLRFPRQCPLPCRCLE